MSKLKVLTIIALLVIVGSEATANGIQFDKFLSWIEIKEKAKKEGKFIFLDMTATWCGPCQFMNNEVFSNGDVGSFFNTNFLSIQVQIDKTNNDSDYVKSWFADADAISKIYHVSYFPTLLFFSPDGEIVHQVIGFRDVGQLLSDASDALSPERQLYTRLKIYEKGKTDTAFLRSLAIQANNHGEKEKANLIARKVINSLSYEELLQKNNLPFVHQFTISSKDRSFLIYQKDLTRVNALLGPNTAERKIRTIVGKEEIETLLKDKEREPDWTLIIDIVGKKYGEIGREKVYGEQMVYYWEKKNWKKFSDAYLAYFKTAYGRSEYNINNLSWRIFENINELEALTVAVKTMKYSIEHFDKNDYQAYDTYANLLYKIGNVREAIEWEEKVVEGISNQKWPSETLEKMKKGVPTWIVPGSTEEKKQ